MQALYDDCGYDRAILCIRRPHSRELKSRLETSLREPAEMVGRSAGGGLRRDFTADKAECARLIKALHQKGVSLARLACCDLNLWPSLCGV
jgi:hypothetical protein